MTMRIKFEYVTASSVDVRGYGARDLLEEVTGRAPTWSTITKAWVCQPHTALDAMALAESRNWDVSVTGVRSKVEWPSGVRDLTGVASAPPAESSAPESDDSPDTFVSPAFVDSGLW